MEYNNTNIQCRATLSDGETINSNDDTLLVQGERELLVAGGNATWNLICLCIYFVSSLKQLSIIGLLPSVGSLTATPIPLDSIISLTWTPPFSLNIRHVDPDITGYCVGVVNPTSSLVIHSQCGITDTQYNYTVSPNDIVCDTYTFTVTPVNIVGNGETANVTRGILPSG